jgi:hypothetical protein
MFTKAVSCFKRNFESGGVEGVHEMATCWKKKLGGV